MSGLLGSRAVRLIVAAALTTYLLWISQPADIVRAAAQTDWRWVALACGLVLFDRSLQAWRWVALLRPVSAGGGPPLGAVMRVFFISSFVGTFLPTSIGGDAARTFGVMQHEVAGSAALASVLMDRALGVVSMLLLGLVSALVLSAPAPAGVYAILAIGGAVSLVLAAVIFVQAAGETATAAARVLPGARLRGLGIRLIETIRTYRHHHGTLAGVLAASIAVQVLRVLQAWGLGRALHLAVPIDLYFVAVPVILIVMLLPVTVSGIGTSQAAFLWTFGAAGVPRADAFALSVLFVALGVIGNLPGGLLYAFGRQRSAA